MFDDLSPEEIARLNEDNRYAVYSAFKVEQGALDADRAAVAAEFEAFLHEISAGDLVVRGVYDLTGMRAEADLLIWWHATKMEDLQSAYRRFLRETRLGQACRVYWTNAGQHRPSEFNRSHLPSFIVGKAPKDWFTVYPFVRSYDWYVMDPKERGRILRDHGMAAAGFDDVLANTIEAFALGDYEWLLSFEADELHRIVELMHRFRDTEARLHVREEIPFFTGRRVSKTSEDLAAFIAELP